MRVLQSSMRLFLWRLLLFSGVAMLQVQDGFSVNRYIEIINATVNIRSSPSTRSRTVAKAKKGDILELKGEEDKWYEVRLFSGESRFLYKTLAKPVSYSPQLPEDLELRRELFRAWKELEEKIRAEAAKKFPPEKNLGKNLEEQQILSDQYKLDLMRKFQVPAPAYRRIVLEGVQKGW